MNKRAARHGREFGRKLAEAVYVSHPREMCRREAVRYSTRSTMCVTLEQKMEAQQSFREAAIEEFTKANGIPI